MPWALPADGAEVKTRQCPASFSSVTLFEGWLLNQLDVREATMDSGNPKWEISALKGQWDHELGDHGQQQFCRRVGRRRWLLLVSETNGACVWIQTPSALQDGCRQCNSVGIPTLKSRRGFSLPKFYSNMEAPTAGEQEESCRVWLFLGPWPRAWIYWIL